MKRKIKIAKGNGVFEEKQITYIPMRYILSILLMLLEILQILAIVILLCIYLPFFYLAVFATQIGCVLSIIARKDNPDYKIPWLLFVLTVPIVGFMCYLLLYSRKLSKKQMRRLDEIKQIQVRKDCTPALQALYGQSPLAHSQATSLKALSGANLYQNTAAKYYPVGEALFPDLLADLRSAKEFVFMEYFIIEQGIFWDSILEILAQKAKEGVEIRIVYDDIGCMTTLPGDYHKQLKKLGLHGVSFARLRGQANNEFNNRSHRKITVIDGKIGYTGGMNIADEYINEIEKFGHWKDVALRLEGEGVDELTRLFLCDYQMSDKKSPPVGEQYYRNHQTQSDGFCIPFGDGPKPVFDRQVSKTAILHLLGQAEKYVYITTPYLIIDNDLAQGIENAALRGVDVRIITPRIPDKKLVFTITRSYYSRLIASGVKIYEYAPGFIHAKTYLADDCYAIVGTMNLDYRSLVHHFENGVWLYKHPVLTQIKEDFLATQEKSIAIQEKEFEGSWLKKFFLAVLKIFTPLL